MNHHYSVFSILLLLAHHPTLFMPKIFSILFLNILSSLWPSLNVLTKFHNHTKWAFMCILISIFWDMKLEDKKFSNIWLQEFPIFNKHFMLFVHVILTSYLSPYNTIPAYYFLWHTLKLLILRFLVKNIFIKVSFT